MWVILLTDCIYKTAAIRLCPLNLAKISSVSIQGRNREGHSHKQSVRQKNTRQLENCLIQAIS